MCRCWLLVILILNAGLAWSQQVIEGKVLDEKSKEPLSYATVFLKYPVQTSYTEEDGTFSLTIPDMKDSVVNKTELVIILDGYKTAVIEIDPTKSYDLDILLEDENETLDEVVVRSKKARYRNRDNPAVTLIRNVIRYRDENQMNSAGYAKMKSFEKMNFGSSNMPRYITHNPLHKPFRFIFDNVDTTRYKGSKTIILFLDETWSDAYLRKSPPGSKKIVHQRKRVSLNPNLINEEGTVAMLKHLYQDINVYDNQFLLVTNNFKSPISFDGPTYYKYFITDTSIINDKRYVHLDFVPRNKTDLLLQGDMIIAIDENFAVKQMYMEITNHTNLNFVTGLSVKLEFEKAKSDKYYLARMENDVQMMMPLSKRGRVVGTRTVVNSEFEEVEHLPDSLFNQPLVDEKENYEVLPDSIYESMRPIAFTPQEQKTYDNLDSIKKMPYFKRLVDGINIISTGHKNLGLIEIGDIYRLYSRNDVEGNRFRLSVRTNPVVAKRYQASSYFAYGTLDKTFKYMGNLTWSLKNQRIYDYPMHYFRLTSQYDMKVPGRVWENNVTDFVTDNIQRGENNKFVYAQTFRIDYVKEFGKNIVMTLDAAYLNQRAGGTLYFVQQQGTEMDTLPDITSNNLGIQLRWAPGEKFFNNRINRKRQHNNMPVFLLRGDFGFKDVLGGDYQFQRLSFQAEKRFFMGAFGNLDINIKANYLWGELPYPLLNIPRANQGYTFTTSSYNMMNHGEFVTDKQVEFLANYRMFGFVLNKIPLIKVFKLREVFGFKAVYGGLSNINNPVVNPLAMQFPTDASGNSYIHTFKENVPYMEWNVGVENIFKVIRVDYVRRVNYLDHTNVSPHRFQVTLVFDF